MRRKLFWLSEEQWRHIEPHLPKDVQGKARVHDRRVISGIVRVIKSGCRRSDFLPEYGVNKRPSVIPPLASEINSLTCRSAPRPHAD